MTDEKYERVREKLDDALDRERTLRHALEWYIGSRFHAMNQTLCDHPICVRIQRADEPPGAGMLAFGGERVLYVRAKDLVRPRILMPERAIRRTLWRAPWR